MLLVNKRSNLFISLRPEGRLHVSQLLLLYSEESESELSLLESQKFLGYALIFLILSISRRKPDLLEILKIIFFSF